MAMDTFRLSVAGLPGWAVNLPVCRYEPSEPGKLGYVDIKKLDNISRRWLVPATRAWERAILARCYRLPAKALA